MIVDPDHVGRRFLPGWAHEHVVTVETVAGCQPGRREDHVGTDDRTVGFEVQDVGRGRHDPNRAAGRSHGDCECFRAGRIRTGREADQHLTVGHQDVAAVDEPVVDPGDGREPGLEISGDRLRLAEPTRRTRPQHDRV